MLARVERFEIVGPYRLRVEFNDGSSGIHDFTSMVASAKGIAVELREQALFDRVRLEFGALTWPNDFDISPERLRREMATAGELHPAIAAE